MIINGVDERHLVRERDNASFLLYIYKGSDTPHTSWSVDSRLIVDAQLDEVLTWLPTELPEDCCWTLGVVTHPQDPSTESDLHVTWIVGADLLNTGPDDRSPEEQRIVDSMLARRHRVALP